MEAVKIMPRFGWGKGTELLNAVQNCMIQRLTPDESLQFLESKGFKMSKLKLSRIKRYIRESTQDRLDFITSLEYATSHIDAIDTIKTINDRLWEISKEKKGSKEEIKALELIPNNVKILVELYDSNPIVASISEKLGVKSDVS
jgi:Leucine-rich repeat (LRR) protein